MIPGRGDPGPTGAIETSAAGAPRIELEVLNTGDRPVQVGSHFHFAEANAALEFDRDRGARPPARHRRRHRGPLRAGHHPDGRARPPRPAPGVVPGLTADRRRWPGGPSSAASGTPQLYGPTTGDRIRLADTDLLIEVTEDLCGGPGRAGDEAVFGGGKVIRESMGQGRATRAEGAPDLVITGAVVLDHWGIVKADVGIRDGRIVALGKAGNPDTMDGVHPDLVIGPGTEVLAGNGRILTAGAIDCHVHFICPQIVPTALGLGNHHADRRRHRPGRGHRRRPPSRPATGTSPGCSRRWTRWPVNVALLGKGNTVCRDVAGRAAAGRRQRLQAARGLGLDARRDRRRLTRGRASPGSRWRCTPTR